MKSQLNEDMPTNSASSGLVAGLGSTNGDPPVNIKNKKKLRNIIKRKDPA